MLREVSTETVDVKVNKGKTETIQVNVDGAIFSEYPGTKVELVHGLSTLYVKQSTDSMTDLLVVSIIHGF